MPAKIKKLSADEQKYAEVANAVGKMAMIGWKKVFGLRIGIIKSTEEITSACIEQAGNFIQKGMLLQPKQWEMAAAARLADYRCPECERLHAAGQMIKKKCPDCGPRYVGVGGARGGGKSQWMIAQVCLDDCQRFKGLSVLYVRKSAKTLRAQMASLLRKTIPTPSDYNFREQVGVVEFNSGSKITIRHFKDESEIDNFLGEEYDVIAYEELTTLSHEKFKNLNSCLRTSKQGWRPRVYASWNWGGIGHLWVKNFFYDPFLKKQETETKYILTLVTDNKHNDPEYIGLLDSFVGWKYQSWRLGNPDIVSGNFFSHYREDVHVYPCDCPNCKSEGTFVKSFGIVKCGQCDTEFNARTFEDKDAVRWFGSMDYGSSHPNCFHLFAENFEGNVFTVGEVWTVDTGISENAESFKDLLRLHNLDIGDLDFIFSGQDVERSDRKTKDDGSTIKTEYQENGITLTPIHINRVNAFSQMQERLGDVERGKMPTWFIHRSCTNLRTQIQTAQYNEKKPNDILKQNADRETGEGGDDALESGRNGIVGAYSNLLQDAKPVQMGSFKGLSQQIENGGYIDVDVIIAESETADLARRS